MRKHLITCFGAVLLTLLPLLGAPQAAAKAVTDQLGRTVDVPENPRRIISLAPSITEILFALNQQHRVIGVTRFSNYPPAAELIPTVGSYVDLDVEKIVNLAPDLCFATKDGNPLAVVQLLEALDIPVYAVDPRKLDSVMGTLLEIGGLLDDMDRANQVVSGMKRRIQRVRATVAQADSRPKVFYQIGVFPIVSAGSDTCIHELIELAGGENIAAGPVTYPRFSREQILRLAPDVFIITSMARGAVFESVKSEWRRFSQLPAVKNGRIMLVDSDLLDRPTPRLVDGLEMLARIIHPELYEQ